MDAVDKKAKLQQFLDKYKYVALIVFVGVALMLLPIDGGGTKSKTSVATTEATEPSEELKLADILSTIHGAGEVKVLLSESSGEEVIYQLDEDISDNSGSVRKTTVVISDSSRNQQGLIKQIVPATYLGAVIVCQGGDDPVVRLAVVEAASRFTGLTTDKISVLKMK